MYPVTVTSVPPLAGPNGGLIAVTSHGVRYRNGMNDDVSTLATVPTSTLTRTSPMGLDSTSICGCSGADGHRMTVEFSTTAGDVTLVRPTPQ